MPHRIPYLAGQREHVDHFGAEVLDPSLITNLKEIYPAGFSFNQLMIILWRVKKWHLTGSLSCRDRDNILNGTFTADALASYIRANVPFPFIGAAATEETAIINIAALDPRHTNPFYFLTCWADARYEDHSTASGTAAAPEPRPFAGWDIHTLDPAIYYDATTQLFRTSILGRWGNFQNGDRTVPYRFQSFPDFPFRYGPFPISCTLDPVLTAPILLWTQMWSQDNWFDPRFGGSVGGSFTVTATEFWPYVNSAGQPVYDSVTGAQLNDPFS